MNALSRFTLPERIVGISGILLLIGLIAFPWYHVGISGFSIDGQSFAGVSVNYSALQATGAWAGVLALIVLIVLLAELVITRFSDVQLPQLPISWRAAEMYAAIVVLVFLVIKFISHIGNFGWGFYVDMLLAIVLVYGATGLRHSRTVRPMATSAPQHGN